MEGWDPFKAAEGGGLAKRKILPGNLTASLPLKIGRDPNGNSSSKHGFVKEAKVELR